MSRRTVRKTNYPGSGGDAKAPGKTGAPDPRRGDVAIERSETVLVPVFSVCWRPYRGVGGSRCEGFRCCAETAPTGNRVTVLQNVVHRRYG